MITKLTQFIKKTSSSLPDDVLRSILTAQKKEDEKSNAKEVMGIICDNINIAKDKEAPICQDTGSIIFFINTPAGYNQIILEKQITEAVVESTRLGYLRQNSVHSLTGKNSGDNTGIGSPSFHFHQWEKDTVEIKLLLKGGGSENVSAQYSLPDKKLGGRNLEGVGNAILDSVVNAQGQGCGPGFLGVAIGGDRASGYIESKKQLFRKTNDINENQDLAELEKSIVDKSNNLEIGPMGLGGKSTILSCKISHLHRLPASFFVTISYNCWANRRGTLTLEV